MKKQSTVKRVMSDLEWRKRIERRTKIVCTMGPSVDSVEKIQSLVLAGMDVARLNFSHGSHEQHGKMISKLQRVRREEQFPLVIMLDTKGPEIRTGELIGSKTESVEKDDRILLVRKPVTKKGTKTLCIYPDDILSHLKKDMLILFDDGRLRAYVVEIKRDGVVVIFKDEGELLARRGVNIPDLSLALPLLTEQDKKDLIFGCQSGVDCIAASFVRSAEQILQMKSILSKENCERMPVLAKIENWDGINHFDEILQASDGIMIARGDLGVEIPLEKVPYFQKVMAQKCHEAAKPCIIATQMLESMTHQMRPTRAEVSDVANAVYDMSSAVMLSGETAKGQYPIQVVSTMANIVKETELSLDYEQFLQPHHGRMLFRALPSSSPLQTHRELASAIAFSAVKTCYEVQAKAIFVYTENGYKARFVSRLHPKIPLIVMTTNQSTYQFMNTLWGVFPLFISSVSSMEELFAIMEQFAVKRGLVEKGDLVVMLSEPLIDQWETAHMLVVRSVSGVVVRGFQSVGSACEGVISRIPTKRGKKIKATSNSIALMKEFSKEDLSWMKKVKGIIFFVRLDCDAIIRQLMKVAKEHRIPILISEDVACEFLRDGDCVHLDMKNKFVSRVTK